MAVSVKREDAFQARFEQLVRERGIGEAVLKARREFGYPITGAARRFELYGLTHRWKDAKRERHSVTHCALHRVTTGDGVLRPIDTSTVTENK